MNSNQQQIIQAVQPKTCRLNELLNGKREQIIGQKKDDDNFEQGVGSSGYQTYSNLAGNNLDEVENVQHIQMDTFVSYAPPKLNSGRLHPDEVVETLSLSSVSTPDIRYTMAIPDAVIDEGLISNIQLEAALYACQAHERFLPAGERIGYLIGDGAGVGKGRTIATIIYENYLRGRRKAIWLSVSSDLKYDAERDLRDVGATKIPVFALNKLRYGRIGGPENDSITRGVIFATYSSLIGESRGTTKNAKGEQRDDQSSVAKLCNTRLRQLIQWCGQEFDGVIVFDECHRAKNLCPTAGSRPTKTGRVVLELQQALPGARIVYASATGASEPRNMAYMTRLGLWGRGLTFTTFSDFIHAVENRGVGAMEMVAMDMKLRGLYLSRQLSFKGADFGVEEIPLSRDFIYLYDESVKIWMDCRRQFARAMKHIPDSTIAKHNVWAHFWASHQRFFKYLCISAKVDACVRIAMQAIQDKKCVVIGLQSTGESQTLDFLEENGGGVTELVSTAKGVIQNLVKNYFPTHTDSSAIDDFQRMFLLDGSNKSRKRAFDELLYDSESIPFAKRIRNNHLGVDLATERESGGNSEYEEGGSDLYEDSSNCEESENSDDEDESAESDEDSECGSDEEELERLLQSKKDDLKRERESSANVSREINPFCVDLAEEDPWAHNVQEIDDESGSSSLLKADEELLASIEAKRRERLRKREKKRIKMEAMRKKKSQAALFQSKVSNITTAASAEQFIASTNIVGSESQEDNDGSVNLTEIKANLLAAIERLGKLLPPNTLDNLINLLGGPQYVAEMTGRKGRVVAREETGDVEYELRTANSDATLEMMNMVEKDKFMNGEKLVAIISEAASSGISLQSDKRSLNRRRRVHITLELPWSADKAIQQFGRTHRSNQESAPEYLFLISELAGEKRFASIVAKRLESLGALTQGDRRATESRDLSQFNVDTNYGREALEVLLRTLTRATEPIVQPPSDYTAGDFFTDMQMYLEGVGMLQALPNGKGYAIERDTATISKFLNRILGLPVYAQNKLFEYFNSICAELEKQAKLDGTYDMGILDLGMDSDKVQKKESREFRGSGQCGDFIVEMHKIVIMRGVSWEEAMKLRKKHRGPKDGFYTSLVGLGGNGKQSVAFIFGLGVGAGEERQASSTTASGAVRLYCLTRPNTGRSPRYETWGELVQRFKPISETEARQTWEEQFAASEQMCQHRYFYGKCSTELKGVFCEVGRRVRTYFVLSGSLICVWPELEEILSEGKGGGGKRVRRRMQIVRVRTENNQRIVGLLVMPNYVVKLVALLDAKCSGKDRASSSIGSS